MFSCHLSFEALPSTVWARGTVDTRGEVGGLPRTRKVMSYSEFIIKQAQQWGEGRSNYFRPSGLWQCLPTVLRLSGSSCPVQVCQHQEKHEFSLVCCQTSSVVGHSCSNKSGGFPFPHPTCQSLCLGHASFLETWDSSLHLLNQEEKMTKKTHKKTKSIEQKMLWKKNSLRSNPQISKYGKHQKNSQNWSCLKLLSLSYNCWFWWDLTHNFLNILHEWCHKLIFIKGMWKISEAQR